jgi:hypothetical protein
MQKALAGLIVAAALAVSASGATVFGIDAWKIALAAAGAVIFVLGGTRPTTTKTSKVSDSTQPTQDTRPS